MLALTELNQKQNRLIAKYLMGAGLMENSEELNDHNRDMVMGMYSSFGLVLLGRFNAGVDNKDELTLYEGQPILNFDYDFCIPKYDRLLVDLMREWRKNQSAKALDACIKRVINLYGALLIWS